MTSTRVERRAAGRNSFLWHGTERTIARLADVPQPLALVEMVTNATRQGSRQIALGVRRVHSVRCPRVSLSVSEFSCREGGWARKFSSRAGWPPQLEVFLIAAAYRRDVAQPSVMERRNESGARRLSIDSTSLADFAEPPLWLMLTFELSGFLALVN